MTRHDHLYYTDDTLPLAGSVILVAVFGVEMSIKLEYVNIVYLPGIGKTCKKINKILK